MAFKKRTEIIDIIDIADKGLAVGRTKEGRVVFVEGPVPGDQAEVLIYKKRKGNLLGAVQKIIHSSPHRKEPVCSHFDICGGCKWQNLAYEKQLEFKERQVLMAFEKIAGLTAHEVLPAKGAGKTEFYRNKLEFSFSNKRWLTKEEIDTELNIGQENVLGFHAPGNFEKIIAIEKCHLQADPSNDIRNFIRDFTKKNGFSYWDAKSHIGFMRNIIIRTSNLGLVMLLVVFSENNANNIKKLLDAVLNEFPAISSLYYFVNTKFNDSIADLKAIHYSGEKNIREKLGNTEYLISPKSFFQTNSYQSKVLYDIAVEFAGFKGDEHVLDLYTGTGSIAIYVADRVKSVTGIEVVHEAIDDARENAKLNGINNAEFIAGDVRDILNESLKKPDVLIVDPPRAGLEKNVVELILKIAPPKIIYISCNPATQARDVSLMKNEYDLRLSQAVDMFPHTHHIENVVLLIRKAGIIDN